MKIETKFGIGDKVWVMFMNRPAEDIIIGIGAFDNGLKNNTEVQYKLRCYADGIWFKEQDLFSSKEELLADLAK